MFERWCSILVERKMCMRGYILLLLSVRLYLSVVGLLLVECTVLRWYLIDRITLYYYSSKRST